MRSWWWATVEDGHRGRPLLITYHRVGDGMARCEVPVRNLPPELRRLRLVGREYFPPPRAEGDTETADNADAGVTTLALERIRVTR